MSIKLLHIPLFFRAVIFFAAFFFFTMHAAGSSFAEEPFQDLYPPSSGYSKASGSSNYIMGYAFTPKTDGEVTHLWCYSEGTKTVRLYDADGNTLASTSVTCGTASSWWQSGDPFWGSSSISPVAVSGGTTYIVAVTTGGGSFYFKSLSDRDTDGVRIESGISTIDSYPTLDDTDSSRAWGFADITFSPTGGGGDRTGDDGSIDTGDWVWLGNGNSSYSGTVTDSLIGTVPSGATHLAFGIWADESNYTNLEGDQENYTMTFNDTSSCENSDAPGSGSVETSCEVYSDMGSSNTWTSYSDASIGECDISYDASTREVRFDDQNSSESCHYAVFYNGEEAEPIPLPTSTPAPTPTDAPNPTPTSTPLDSERVVLLVEGDVNIDARDGISVPPGDLFLLAAKGNIVIDEEVGGNADDTTTHLEGIYSAEGSIILEGDGCRDGIPDRRLNVGGILVANSLRPFAEDGNGVLDNRRSLCSDNLSYPTLYVTSRYDFLLKMTDFYKTRSEDWREALP